MNKIQKILASFRAKRSEQLLNSDSLSFDSFKTDTDKPIYEKESTLINSGIVISAENSVSAGKVCNSNCYY